MSYILDALKKSSEERRKLQKTEERTDTFLATPLLRSRSHASRRTLIMVVFTCLIIISAAGLWFFLTQEKGHRQVPVENERSAAGQPQTRHTTGTGNPPAVKNDIKTSPSPAELQGVKPEESSVTRAEGKTTSASRETVIPLQNDLPFSTRSQIPEMKYSGHVFSDNPELRMILINTSVIREGDPITPELKLVEITRNGLIMNYQDTKFRIVLF